MFFHQIVRQDIGCAAYIVGSTDAGEAAVIDPRIDMVDEIIGIAAQEALRIRYVIETHNHADHVAGHHQLAQRTGAAIAVHEAAGVNYPHRPLHDGEELALGEVRLRVLHTPGHRPEHIAIAAIDTTRGDEPWLVLTGDSLFIGDVARPDLAIDGREGAASLFHSLRQQLLRLPEGTMVYPGHVSGSLCGRMTNRMTGTTIGFERRQRAAGSARKADLTPQPPDAKRIAAHHRDVGIRAGPIPAACDHGEAHGVFAQGREHARQDALGATVRPVGGMDERNVQRRGHADGSWLRRRRSSTKACFANAAKADEAAIRMPRQPSRQDC
mgnify:CR=1 FL=1